MGTNFYWAAVRSETDHGETPSPPTHIVFADGERRDLRHEGRHIGKRSAAGLYCWDCDLTLCREGNGAIHYGSATWHAACPKCGSTKIEPGSLSKGPAAVELGFAEPNGERPRGVEGTSSFSWAIDPHEARRICESYGERVCVVDEYGRTLTGLEFLRMLRCNCAIEFTHSIGREFS